MYALWSLSGFFILLYTNSWQFISCHGLQNHVFANDAQFCIFSWCLFLISRYMYPVMWSFDLVDIFTWMSLRQLKLRKIKTKLIFFSLESVLTTCFFNSERHIILFVAMTALWNLSIIFDSCFDFWSLNLVHVYFLNTAQVHSHFSHSIATLLSQATWHIAFCLVLQNWDFLFLIYSLQKILNKILYTIFR